MENHPVYSSPFSWRYSSQEMRQIWSEEHKHRLWRKMWAALARAESAYGLVSLTQLADIEGHIEEIDLAQAALVEAETRHDLMAAIKVYAGQCPIGGSVLHLGATSMDIEDNADALRIKASCTLLLTRLADLLSSLAGQMELWAGFPVMGFTHLQAAEPTTLGYRLALTAQDLLEEYQEGKTIVSGLRGKGFKGAVGTGAAFAELVGVNNLEAFEQVLSQLTGLQFFEVTSQTYPRLQEFRVVSWLAAVAGSLNKFAFDLRILQSPALAELQEPFGAHQVGSSAMPFKRNPISAEKINSLARFLAQLPRLAWDNYANSLLERTLDDSANRRLLLPEACLTADELLLTARRLVDGMEFDSRAARRSLDKFGPFAATERILLAVTRRGADRLAIHEILRQLSLTAWEQVSNGEKNLLVEMIQADTNISIYLSKADIAEMMNVDHHTGMAEIRTQQLALRIRAEIGEKD